MLTFTQFLGIILLSLLGTYLFWAFGGTETEEEYED